MPYDLFISYSRRDNDQGRITQLVERIKTDFAPFAKRELVPFFDQQEIHGMSDWRQRILQGLRESRLLLACLSPAYLQSEYCEWEFVEYLKYEIGHLHGFNGVAPIYFVEVPGWDSKDFEQQCAAWIAELRKRQHFDLRPWHDQGEEALRETAVQERMGKLNRQIVQTITRGERAEKSLGNVDAHNPHFIGRTANLRMLRENFVTPGHIGVVTAVNGVGGLGKTALAIEYAHAFADEYGGGRWQVRCAGKDDLRLALAELATPIGFEFTDDEKKNADLQFERTRRELKKLADARAPHRCLLLLDNVDRPGLLDPAQVARLNGGDWLHVLATTRLGENELHGAHRDRSFLAIDELPPDDALALIESYQPDGRFRSEAERDAAREIVRLLGSFTLAVESAAVYLGQFANDVTCAAFLARLKKEGLEGLDSAASQSSEGVLHGEKRLRSTLQPTLERLGASEKLALEFAALLPPDQVPLPWLRALVAKTFPEMEHDAEPGYPDPWKSVVRRLLSLRLLQTTDDVDDNDQPRVVRVHRLVQELVVSGMESKAPSLNQRLIDYTRIRARFLWDGWEELENRWEIVPVAACARRWRDADDANVAELMVNAAGPLRFLGQFKEAEELLRSGMRKAESDSGGSGPVFMASLTNLAELLHVTNRMEEAEALVRKVLTMMDTIGGPDWRAASAALNTLGSLLRDLGKMREAESVLRKALTNDREWFGSSHPNVARDANNLAILLKQTAQWREAETLFRLALDIDERHFGVQHLKVAKRLSNLAVFLSETSPSSRPEVKSLSERALRIAEAKLHPNHPDLAVHLVLRATVLTASDQWKEGLKLFQRALAIEEQAYGPDHPTLAATLICIGDALMDHQRPAEAEPAYQRALTIRERSCPSGHPLVAAALNNLAQALSAMGQASDAEQLIRRSLEIVERVHGTEHPDVAVTLNTLAVLLQESNRLTEAEPLSRRHFEILLRFTTTTGRIHPHLLDAAGNYANLLEHMGHSREEADEQVFAVARRFGIQLGDG